MINFIKKYKLIIFLLILVIILVVVKIISKPDNNSSNIKTGVITPTPNIVLNLTPTFVPIILGDVDFDYPLDSYLPYKTENFIVERYKSPRTLKVQLLSGDKNKAELEIKTWIEGIMQEKDTHILIWIN